MINARQQVARVWVDYSQYAVAAGPDIEASEDIIPGLLLGIGDQAVAVITGLQWGKISVTAQAMPTTPAVLDTGWDVVAETDLVCPEGVIAVCDWSGPAHSELGELAIAGAGRYRLRVHARHREQVSETQSAEEHHLLIWPTSQSAPPQLLTPMDAYGLIFNGEQSPDVPTLDALDATAAAAVNRLAAFVTQPAPPELSGELTTVHVETVAPATPRKVWNHVSNPWHWVGLGGSTNPAGFHIYLNNEPELNATGEFVANEPPTHLAYTWSWTTNRWAEAETQFPVLIRGDLVTGEITTVTETIASLQAIPSWMLPPRPTTVDIRLRRHSKGTTTVELQHRDLPVELAEMAKPFWEWALRELRNRLTGAPFHGYPWNR